MNSTLKSLGVAGICLVFALSVTGCGGAAERRDLRDELDDLRARRDRELAEMEGRPVEPRPRRARPLPEEPPEVAEEDADEAASFDLERPEPAWVQSGASPQYPLSEYITGVGSCRTSPGREYESLVVAENRARDAIARNIRVRIRSELQTQLNIVTERQTGETEVKADTTAMAGAIKASTDVVLEGARVVDQWYDPSEDAFWMLAALERKIAGENIAEQIANERARIAERLRLEREAETDLSRLAHANAARNSALAVLSYRVQLRIISPRHAVRLMPLEEDALLLDAWSKSLRRAQDVSLGAAIFVQGEGGGEWNARYAGDVSERIRAMGLPVVELPAPEARSFRILRRADARTLRTWAGPEMDALLIGELEARLISTANLGTTRLFFYQARGEGVVIDPATERVLAAAAFDFAPETHTGRSDRREALNEALRLGADELGRRLSLELADTLNAVPAGREASE